MAFLDDDYLLTGETARRLYESVEGLPVLDPHNHGDVREIVEDEGWSDIWEVEGATDHYVWELMRRRGVPENKVTGDASNREKWNALAEVFPGLAGNPTYEWIHLDLSRRFGIDEVISGHTADLIWKQTRELLDSNSMRPQRLLREMKVRVMCTTDEPDSDLTYHRRAREEVEGITILPTWRPDGVLNIGASGWRERVENLGEEMGTDVSRLKGMLEALEGSHIRFRQAGCVASDHGLFVPHAHYVDQSRVEKIHERAFAGGELTPDEIGDYRAFMLHQCGSLDSEAGWTMQLHIGAVRDYRDELFNRLGPDSGGDVSSPAVEVIQSLRDFLNEFDSRLTTVVYYLDPVHLPALSTLARAFPSLNLGAPWWFNDSPYGMERHLNTVATIDLLYNGAGMVTDSRKLVSYGSRTEMFRRVLSSTVGRMVDRGQMPERVARELVAAQSFYRPRELFFSELEC